MRIYFFFIVILTLTAAFFSVSAVAQINNFETGSQYFEGPSPEVETNVGLGKDTPGPNATGSNATADMVPVPKGDKTALQATKKAITGKPINMPSMLDGLENVGTDFTPRTTATGFELSNGLIRQPFVFNSEDYIRYTPLELAQVNGVHGYLGTASRGGVDIQGSDGRPQEYFVPANQLKDNMYPGYYSDMANSIRSGNHTVNNHVHDENCEHDTSPYPDEIVEQTSVPRKAGYLPGCEALAVKDGPTRAHRDELSQCISSIKKAVASVSRDKDGGLNRAKWMCNVMAQLNPQEQQFAAMVFTAGVEAGMVATSSHTGEPGWKETMFVQKVMLNRTRQLQSDHGKQHNAMDVALAYKQFSMYNKSEFNKFRHYFEPNSNRGKKQLDMAVESFIALHERPELLQPQPQIERMDSYFSPYGMLSGSSRTSDGRTRTELIRDGLVPKDYPATNQKGKKLYVPKWNFNKFNQVAGLNFDGRPVRDFGCGGGKSCPGYHVFYERKSGSLFYGGDVDGILKRRQQCGGKNTVPENQVNKKTSSSPPPSETKSNGPR